MPIPPNRLLRKVARLYNLQTVYYDMFGNLRQAAPEAVLAVLQSLGAPIQRMEDLGDALRHRRQVLWQNGLDPVAVAWDGAPPQLKIRVPAAVADAEPRYRITLEHGEVREGVGRMHPAHKPVTRSVDGSPYVMRRVGVPETLPLGYHRIALTLGDFHRESHLFSAPRAAYTPPSQKKIWGLFCPLYALRTERNWGVGDLGDLAAFSDLTAELGGRVVGTLPLLAAFLDEPFNPSPYAPVSRLFWNELYLDVPRIPELQRCPVARAMLNSTAIQTEIETQRAAALVDYRRAMALKRRILEELAHCALKQPSDRLHRFRRFIETQPLAEDYAEFRAQVERVRRPWMLWPAVERGGTLKAGDYEQTAKQYHLYVQWQCQEQMEGLAARTKPGQAVLYLDFPVGVSRDGYDVWRERDLFALQASGGAPPDAFFTNGQNWGFPPVRPDQLRAQGYRYYIRSLQHHLQHAGLLRIDHVIGLHRSFWVPDGFCAIEGMYMRYPAEEFYAVLSIESHRHQAQIVGENLGTVPPYVNTAMAQHNISGMAVGQFAIAPEPEKITVPEDWSTVASLNTHDTPTFAGFWSGADIDDRLDLGLLNPDEASSERQTRALQRDGLIAFLRARGWAGGEPVGAEQALKGWLSELAQANPFLLLINLEDLWLELQPQNVPGTWRERPNWQRKTRLTLEQFRQFGPALDILKAVDEARSRQEG